MLNEGVSYKAKGHLKVTRIFSDGSSEILYDDKNLIIANAKKILVHAIGGDGFILDEIKAYKATVLLATTPSLIVTYPAGDDKVRFEGLFDEASFDDTLDELRLVSSLGGEFSTVTGLSNTKDATSQLQVSWQITLNDL